MNKKQSGENIERVESISDAGAAARVEQLLAELDTAYNIDDREDLLSRQLANLDPVTRCAYARALATDAFEQSQDLCFILSQLSVAMAGTEFVATLNTSIHELNETLEHLSITGGADEEQTVVPDATVTETESTHVADQLRLAELAVVAKIDELHEAIRELEELGGGNVIVDAAMLGTNALGDHLEGIFH